MPTGTETADVTKTDKASTSGPLTSDHLQDSLGGEPLHDALPKEPLTASAPSSSPSQLPVPITIFPPHSEPKGRRGAVTPGHEELARGATSERAGRIAALGLPEEEEGADGPLLLRARTVRAEVGGEQRDFDVVGEGDVGSVVVGTPTSLAEVAQMDGAAIDRYPDLPVGGPQARPILQGAFGSNWFFAKDVLVQNKWPAVIPAQSRLRTDSALREKLMWKLLALRHYEYNGILDALRERYKDEERGELEDDEVLSVDSEILDWGSAGSDSLTSDVDVNLGGKYNMRAVADFNMEFRGRGWPYEAGTVYDVNVYCKDNMHGIGFEKMAAQEKAIQDEDSDAAVMTIATEANMPADIAEDAGDIRNQEVAAMMKLIRFMTHSGDWRGNARWAQYKKALKCDDETPFKERPGEMYAKVVMAQARYDRWRKSLDDMKRELVASGSTAVDTLAAVAADSAHKYDDALTMQASNRLYERKIEELQALRDKLARLADDDSGGQHQREIRLTAVQLRQAILEAGMYANEAMITAGASNFVVFGTQTGAKGKTLEKAKQKLDDKKLGSIQIRLTESQLYHAFTEQLADTIKEFEHFDSLDSGLYKGGKYLMRMTLAADQLDGVTPGAIANYNNLRWLGDLPMSAKDRVDGKTTEKQKVMAQGIREKFPELLLTPETNAADKEAFLEIIVAFGCAVTTAHKAAKDKQQVIPPAPPPDAMDPSSVAARKKHQTALAVQSRTKLRLAEVQGANLARLVVEWSQGQLTAKAS